MARTVPDWDQKSFEMLAHTVLETVAAGGSVTEACEKFEKITNGLRSKSANRFKWTVKLSKEYAKEYAIAREMGAKAQQENAAQRHSVVRGIGTHEIKSGVNEDGPRQISQRQFLKLIRDNYIIVPDDYDELINDNERLRREAAEAKRELERVQRKLTLLEAKYGELQSEHERVLDAFNIARRQYTGVSSPSNVKMTIDKHGVLQQVKVED